MTEGQTPVEIFCSYAKMWLRKLETLVEESGVARVECPGCGRVWTLSPGGGVLRFKSHDKRKTTTSNTAEQWAMRETIWNVVGGENK